MLLENLNYNKPEKMKIFKKFLVIAIALIIIGITYIYLSPFLMDLMHSEMHCNFWHHANIASIVILITSVLWISIKIALAIFDAKSNNDSQRNKSLKNLIALLFIAFFVSFIYAAILVWFIYDYKLQLKLITLFFAILCIYEYYLYRKAIKYSKDKIGELPLKIMNLIKGDIITLAAFFLFTIYIILPQNINIGVKEYAEYDIVIYTIFEAFSGGAVVLYIIITSITLSIDFISTKS